MNLIILILVGIGLFLVSKLLEILLRKFSYITRKWKSTKHFVYITQFILLVGYLFWVFNYTMGSKSFYPYLNFTLILILAFFISWFLIKDYIAGFIFRLQNDLKLDQVIQTDEISGKIIRFGNTFLKVETIAGDIAMIPYSRISNRIITKVSKSESADHLKIMLKTKKQLSKEEISREIRIFILNSPWSSFKKPPGISFKEETPKNYLFEITVHSILKKHTNYLEEGLREKFE
ncbi:MAG: mechanosensitive ion channel [Flammeovirgaceae bacterium]|nr:mechanosensitive ion channel [Flammeovirgaceae bacterium]